MVSNVAEETETQKLRKRINHLEATLALAVTSGGIAMLHMRKQRYVAGTHPHTQEHTFVPGCVPK